MSRWSWHKLSQTAAVVLSLLLIVESGPWMAGPDPATFRLGIAQAAELAPPSTQQATNQSLALNGTSAAAEVAPNQDLNLTADWTVETWFKDESPQGFNHDYVSLLYKGDRETNSESPFFVSLGFKAITAGVRSNWTDGSIRYDLFAAGVNPSAWHHVAATFTASTRGLVLYFDGAQVAQGVMPRRSTGNDLPLQIGRAARGAGAKYMQGKLDDLRIWNVVRSPFDIAANYRSVVACPQAGLVANWQFDEGLGNLPLDCAGPHTATLLGGATFSTDTPGSSPAPTATPTPTATSTNTPTPTSTPTETPTPTATSTNTSTPTATSTNTSTPTATSTNTSTPTATSTSTPLPVIPPLSNDYRYRVVAFNALPGFEKPGFDDSSFANGNAAFGTISGYFCPLIGLNTIRTEWPVNTDLLLRKRFELPSDAHNLKVFVTVDNDAQVFVNGVDVSGGLLVHENCATPDEFTIQVPDNLLVSGTNLLAVRGRDRGGLAYFDLHVTGLTGGAPLPTATPLPAATATNTPTPTATATSTNTPVPAATATSTPTETPTPTATPTETSTPTPTSTNTPPPAATSTSTPTMTPTATATSTNATNTPTPAPPSGPPPTAAITSPADGSAVSGPTAINGTASSGTLLRYTLEYSQADESGGFRTYTTFATGTTSVTNGALGTFDPTVLLNGTYQVRLTVTDISFRTAAVSRTLVVQGMQKVGNFSISFVDLQIPAAGLPIEVVRTYDSRDKAKGDFGVGWRLGLRSVTARSNGFAGDGWRSTVSGGFFPTYCVVPATPHIVTITFPDGTTFKFQPVITSPANGCQQLLQPQFVNIGYQALPGTNASLTPLNGNADLLVSGGFPSADVHLLEIDTFEPADPSSFQLNLNDGRSLVIDRVNGLQSVTDANGNRLTITDNGVTHSGGKNVTFVRDAARNITSIVDSAGTGTITYGYSAAGDLTSVTDQTGNITRFTYNGVHGLLSIQDPRGAQPARNEYDDAGRLIAIVDANGNRTQFQHDLSLRQEVITDRLGNQSVLGYDQNGNVTSRRDANGHTTSATYDANNNVLTQTDALGQITRFTYDAHNNLLTRTDPLGNVTRFTYDANDRILTSTDGNNHTTTNVYDTRGNLLTTTNSTGAVTTFTYDSRGNILTKTDANSQVFRYEYDSSGNLTRITDPLGSTTFTVDGNGNPLSQTATRVDNAGASHTVVNTATFNKHNQILSATDAAGTIRNEYDELGKISAVTNPNGVRLAYRYDLLGNMDRQTYPDGSAVAYAYDVMGRRTSATDRAGRTTTYEYDKVGQLTKTTFPGGAFSSTTFDDAGRVKTSTDENGHTTTFNYDNGGQLLSVVDAQGHTTSFTYDRAGNRLTSTDTLNHTTSYLYDNANRLTRITYHDGTTTQFAYDGLGRKTSETDQEGHTTRFEHDAVGRLTKITDALNHTTTYTYDAVGDRLAQTDGNGRINKWDYDDTGRVTAHTLPLGQSENFTYDPNGNVRSHTDFNGRTINADYDQFNRPIRKTYPDGSRISFTYTSSGQRETVVDSRGTTRYEYDARDRLLKQTNPDGSTLEYTYDARGNRTSVTTAAGRTSYAYDEANRLRTVTDARGLTSGFAYDAAGNRTKLTLPTGATIDFTYDVLNRLTSVVSKRVTGQIIASFSYTLDRTGTRTSVTDNAGVRTDYQYDPVYRLTREIVGSQSISYDYDNTANRTRRTDSSGVTNYTYDINDRLISEGSNAYTYDNNGNTLTRSDASGVTRFSYDFDDRLTSAQTPSGSFDYTYDVDGMRVGVSGGAATARYVVDSNRALPSVLEDRDGSGALRAAYTYGDSDLLSQTRSSAVSYYHGDGLGSARALTDATGATTDTYAYDAFGNLAASTGSTVNDFLFNSQQLDRSTGLYYLRARYYDARVGRFTAADTFPGSAFSPMTLHKYAYANLNPVNVVDPSGLCGCTMDFAIAMDMQQILAGMAILSAFAVLSTVAIQLYQSHAVTTITWPNLSISLAQTTAGTQVIAQERTKAKEKVQDITRTNPGCEGNILYHYTDRIAAESILGMQEMWLTRKWTEPSGLVHPRGVYATSIPPWAEMTQSELAKMFYFAASRQAIADLSWTVIICNDVPPPFVPLGPTEWWKPDGNVHVIGILPNAMP